MYKQRVTRQGWAAPPARVDGDRLLEMTQLRQSLSEAKRETQEALSEGAANETRIDRVEGRQEALESDFRRLKNDIPKMSPGAGGGRRTIRKFLTTSQIFTTDEKTLIRSSFGILDHVIFPENYGAVGDGVTNDTAAINLALAVPKAVVLLTKASYVVTTLTPSAGTTLLSYRKSKLIRHASATDGLISINSVSNVTIDGIEFDRNGVEPSGGQAAIWGKTTSAAINDITIKNCIFRNGSGRADIYFTQHTYASKRWTIEGNQFYDNPAGCFWALLRVAGGKRVKFTDNYLDGVGGAIVLFRRYDTDGVTILRTRGHFKHGDFSRNIYTDLTGGVDGPVPMEVNGFTHVKFNENTMDSGTRGLGIIGCTNAVANDNTIANQTAYFCELANSDGVTFDGNTVKDCKSLINDNPLSGEDGSSNVTVTNNTFTGGIAPYSATVSVIQLNINATVYKNWLIANNQFIDVIGVRSIIRSVTSLPVTGFIVQDNYCLQSIVTASPQFIHMGQVTHGKILRNTIIRTADVDATTPTLAATSPYTFISYSEASSNLEIAGNVIEFTGDDTRVGAAKPIGIGNFETPAALPSFVCSRNTVRGTNMGSPLYIAVTSTDAQVEDNDLRTAGGTTTINAAIVSRRTKRIYDAPAGIPDNAFGSNGDVAILPAPSAGATAAWIRVSGVWKTFAAAGA